MVLFILLYTVSLSCYYLRLGISPLACALCHNLYNVDHQFMSFAYLSNFFHHFMVSNDKFCLQGSSNILFNLLLKSFYVVLIFSSL